jgi:GNAT superfamily N-acetyltransferase
MEQNQIRLKWNRTTRIPSEYGVEINGDPMLDAESKCIANMGVWLDCGIIYHLYVQPTWRRRGIAKRLLKEGEKKILGMRKNSIGILVNRMNSEVINYYERRGYHMTDEIMIGYSIMRKERKANCPIPCSASWKINGEACFDKRCPKADQE